MAPEDLLDGSSAEEVMSILISTGGCPNGRTIVLQQGLKLLRNRLPLLQSNALSGPLLKGPILNALLQVYFYAVGKDAAWVTVRPSSSYWLLHIVNDDLRQKLPGQRSNYQQGMYY